MQGIDRIDIYGASPLEWVIEYDVEKLESAGITPHDIKMVVARVLKKENMGVGELVLAGAAAVAGAVNQPVTEELEEYD